MSIINFFDIKNNYHHKTFSTKNFRSKKILLLMNTNPAHPTNNVLPKLSKTILPTLEKKISPTIPK